VPTKPALPPAVVAARAAHDEAETRRLLALLRTGIAAAKNDPQLLELLDVSPSELAALKGKMYAQEAVNLIDRPAEETFVTYRTQMYGVVEDLDAVAKEARGARQFTAAGAALKAKAQIIDKVMERGQEIGVIPRAAKKTEMVGGILVASLTDRELMEQIGEMNKRFNRLMVEYGDKPMSATTLPELYSGPKHLIEADEEE
jgi:hypothetical protein